MARAPVPVLYDGDCGLCAGTARLLGRLDRHGRLELVTFEEARRRGLAKELSPEEFAASFHMAYPERILSGPEAIPEVLRLLPGGAWPAWWIRRSPFLMRMVAVGYSWVARNRTRLGGRACNCDTAHSPHPPQPFNAETK